jgi:hypothetical protein
MATVTQEQYDNLLKRHERLIQHTGTMRNHQKKFFQDHSGMTLKVAKQWEKKVDELLKEEFDKLKSNQGEIF